MLLNTVEKINELNNKIDELNNKITNINMYSDTYYSHTLLFNNIIKYDGLFLDDAFTKLRASINNFNFKPDSWCGYRMLLLLGVKNISEPPYEYDGDFDAKFNDTEERDPVTSALAYVLNEYLTKICDANNLKIPEYYSNYTSEFKHKCMCEKYFKVKLHVCDNYINRIIDPCYYAWRIINL